jgi:1,4-alpha-glucan branching enzyme
VKSATSTWLAAEASRITAGTHADPHRVLGIHEAEGRWVVRAWLPDALSCTVRWGSATATAVLQHDLWVADLGDASQPAPASYALHVGWPDGQSSDLDDPYRFWPTLGELDLHLIGEGQHRQLWRRLGAHVTTHQGVDGVAFAVWAPGAKAVRVVGEWNFWDGRVQPMRSLGSSGVWELFVPAARAGQLYKYEIVGADGRQRLKADPMATATEVPPGTASRIFSPAHVWQDGAWMADRARTDILRSRQATYECHLGSWQLGRSYRELAELLPEYVASMGFTHVEFLPVTEHPFGGSWGYQVSSYFAPSARFGDPDDFRALVDAFHRAGIGVIIDWVPAHFPRDDWALARFDGTALYEHADPRQGEHPDWGTLVFNFGRTEVRNFLVSSALYWLDEFHIDGLRVDAVASMLYLDYSRREGEWIPNRFGGRENLEAIDLLREVNTLVHEQFPGACTIAEESTAWPAVSRPVYAGGLGFTFKWNMGWMHDTLDYFDKAPVYRRHHHHELTFGLLYAFSENFVLPLSHDEVVHGKRSLLSKMPGDRWQQLANLRALFAWMWAHPGRPLLFMGGELGEDREWSHDRSVEWALADDPGHAGIQVLVRTLNLLAVEHPALYVADFEAEGFRWIDANDADQNVFSFLRFATDDTVACVANLSPIVRRSYRIGLPRDGLWNEILNTDAPVFGGSGVVNGPLVATDEHWHGLPASLELTLPPLGVVWLTPAR